MAQTRRKHLLASGDTGLAQPLSRQSQGLHENRELDQAGDVMEEGEGMDMSPGPLQELWEKPRHVRIPLAVWPIGELEGRQRGNRGNKTLSVKE